MTRYTRNSKEVLQDGKHFADAADETAAMMIVNALRALEDIDANHGRQRPRLNLNTCQVRREGDEMACACGLRWDVEDPNPPKCAHRR